MCGIGIFMKLNGTAACHGVYIICCGSLLRTIKVRFHHELLVNCVQDKIL